MDDISGGWNAVAAEFIARRSSSIGVATVRNWAASIPAGGSILDLGCGHGIPISVTLVEEGFRVYGIEASPDLVLEFRRRVPGAQVRCEAAETSTFFDRRFDAVIAIGLMFLLPEEAQKQLLHRVSCVLRPGGSLLFTAPRQDVSWADNMTGRRSRSLGGEAYEAALRDVGLDLVAEFADEGKNHYYNAKKSGQPVAEQSQAASS